MTDGEFTTIASEGKFYTTQKVGRPTKYDIEKYRKLFEEFKEEYSKEKYLKLEKSHSDGEKSSGASYERKLYVKVPTESAFARFIGISTSTLDNYQNQYPEFLEIIKELLEFQKDFLLDGAISGRMNPLIVKLMLSKLGIREVTETKLEHSGSVDMELSEEQEKKIALRILENDKKNK